jgi:hypothetical protein
MYVSSQLVVVNEKEQKMVAIVVSRTYVSIEIALPTFIEKDSFR